MNFSIEVVGNYVRVTVTREDGTGLYVNLSPGSAREAAYALLETAGQLQKLS